MSTIAIVDDRKDNLETACRRIERGLKIINADSEWRVFGIEPLPHLEDYPSWLVDEEVKVLILDQRLKEGGVNQIDYSGHDIVERIVPRMFDLPVYYLTAITDVGEIEGDASRVQGIIRRDEFFDSASDVWPKEFVRVGKRYEEGMARKLARLGELAEKAVEETILTQEEAEEAAALREELHLVFETGPKDIDSIRSARSELLNSLASELKLFEEALRNLRERLKPDSNQAEV